MTTTSANAQATASTDAGSVDRRIYWNLPWKHGRLVGWTVFTASTMATVAAWAVLLLIWSPLAGRLVWATDTMNAREFFQDATLRVFATTFGFAAITGAVAFLTGLVVAHRIAGPLHRIKLTAAHVADGQLCDRVSVRKEDSIHDFADSFNDMLDHVESRFRRQRHAVRKAQQLLNDAESLLSSENESNNAELEKTIRAALRTLNEARTAEIANETPYT